MLAEVDGIRAEQRDQREDAVRGHYAERGPTART